MDLFNKTLDIPTRFYEVYGFGECSPPNSLYTTFVCVQRATFRVHVHWIASVGRGCETSLADFMGLCPLSLQTPSSSRSSRPTTGVRPALRLSSS